jgi:hypothetical protein
VTSSECFWTLRGSERGEGEIHVRVARRRNLYRAAGVEEDMTGHPTSTVFNGKEG